MQLRLSHAAHLPTFTRRGIPLRQLFPFSTASVFTMAATRRSSRLSSQQENHNATSTTEAMPPPSAPNIGRKRKSASAPSAPSTSPPTTPTKRRMTSRPPLTPTPSAVGVMVEPAAVDSKPLHRRINRLADPNLTNATLLSPESSRLISSKDMESVSPSKAPRVKVTTETLLQEANKYLISVDERMRPLVEKNFCRVFSPEGLAETIDPFESLASGIISQQVSGAAAKSIKAKFVGLFHGEDTDPSTHKRFPHPSEVAACTIEHLRTAGLSQRKAEYIQGLATKFSNGELTAQMLHDVPYEELLEKLLAVRGLGRWSVEMFACFGLKRMDVFSLGDLGVQRGMAAFVGRDVAKLKARGGGKWKYMSEQDMTELSDKFAPYRSLFMWYMWRVEETDVSTME
ncbi:hypothetical protein NLU13_5486 [Sarocladium strictum]|uniref:HhH-GPD domain-containing protein n=1 Tax=Sarocladium strictum TaxID=5046 RepID=A0AA39GGZ7_SARSR|nr:hypothetical protein NLU13_5486 [Sarocladium strictum]